VKNLQLRESLFLYLQKGKNIRKDIGDRMNSSGPKNCISPQPKPLRLSRRKDTASGGKDSIDPERKGGRKSLHFPHSWSLRGDIKTGGEGG